MTIGACHFGFMTVSNLETWTKGRGDRTIESAACFFTGILASVGCSGETSSGLGDCSRAGRADWWLSEADETLAVDGPPCFSALITDSSIRIMEPGKAALSVTRFPNNSDTRTRRTPSINIGLGKTLRRMLVTIVVMVPTM
jgi:hypothetical protein